MTALEAARAKMMRSRKALGIRMVTVPVHKTDLSLLIKLRLLSEEDKQDAGAVSAAMQRFSDLSFEAIKS